MHFQLMLWLYSVALLAVVKKFACFFLCVVCTLLQFTLLQCICIYIYVHGRWGLTTKHEKVLEACDVSERHDK